MKKSPIKEFIITSIAAAVAGFVVKKSYQYLQHSTRTSKSNKERLEILPTETQKKVAVATRTLGEKFDQTNPAEKGLIATLVYTAAAFTVSKLLRKVI